MANQKYPFFTNKECPYFPCHKGVKEDEFNCAFCYCPLYALGDKCGGNPTFLVGGLKSCENCVKPHVRTNGLDMVALKWPELSDMARDKSQNDIWEKMPKSTPII